MLPPNELALSHAGQPLPGDATSFAEALGHPGDLPTLGRSLAFSRPRLPTSIPALRSFLLEYRRDFLVPHELPAIRQAFDHATRYEVRELMAYDRSLNRRTLPTEFAFASQAIGRRYLRRLRPLRDVRLVRRYLDAIQHRQAHGWHTLVYGSVLTIYSLPLRQGLLGYARQTLGGFMEAASLGLRLSPAARGELVDDVWSGIPDAVNRLLVPPNC